jgi:hypothetical protein
VFSVKKQILIVTGILLSLVVLGTAAIVGNSELKEIKREEQKKLESYWFVLHRKSNIENLYYGIAGDLGKSKLVKTFTVKTGIPGERPTPLPMIMGKEYWLIVEKHAEFENPETAPYFLTLNIPAPTEAPFGPVPYEECNGQQCDWVRPGFFGLHGINGDESRLSVADSGSSGCIRHRDEDITYLYNLLDPTKKEIRYYIEDN